MIRLDLAVVRDAEDPKYHRFEIIKLDNKRIYNLIASSVEEKRSWIESVDKLINAWLEVEKYKEDDTGDNSAPVDNDSRKLQKRVSSKREFAPIYKSPLPPGSDGSQESPFVADLMEKNKDLEEILEKRLQKLDVTFNEMLTENQSLKERISELECTIERQGKTIRKLKKNHAGN